MFLTPCSLVLYTILQVSYVFKNLTVNRSIAKWNLPAKRGLKHQANATSVSAREIIQPKPQPGIRGTRFINYSRGKKFADNAQKAGAAAACGSESIERATAAAN